MRDVDLSLSIRHAMERLRPAGQNVAPPPAEPPPDATLAPSDTPSDEPPDERRPHRTWRGKAFGWLYPAVDYVRRFGLAPVLARLDDWRLQSDIRFAQTSAALQQLQDRQTDLLGRHDDLLNRHEDLLLRLRETQTRLGDVERTTGEAKEGLREIRSSLGETHQGLRDIGIRQEGHSAQVERLGAELQSAHGDVQALLSIAGPRFDELEIKVRPLVTFDEESYAVRLADGYAMVPRAEPTLAIMVVNAPSGGLEAGTRRVLQALIAPGMTVADVGANIGLLTLACARAAGPSGRVYAFEPEPGPLNQLEKTVRLNGLSWVTVCAMAAGRKSGRSRFHVSPIIGHSSLYELPPQEAAQARAIEVEVAPLDKAVPLSTPLDVVKIDVEGAELDVLAGMQRHLDANRDIAVIAEFGPSHLARVGVSPQDWWSAFKSNGFSPFAIAEPSGVCTPIALKQALRLESVNIAFVRRGGQALARLPRA